MKNKCQSLLLAALAFSVNACEAASPSTYKATSHVISLTKLKRPNLYSDSQFPESGTFFVLANGEIVIFNSIQYRHFRELLQELPCQTTETMLVFDPLAKSSQMKSCSVEFSASRELTIDGIDVDTESVDRLRLSKKWDWISKYPWKRGCSVLDLGNHRFLITGGLSQPCGFFAVTPIALHLVADAEAVVWNAKTNLCEKKFSLAVSRQSHSTLLLPDGKVFCLGGYSQEGGNHLTPTAEIIDVENSKSQLLEEKFPAGLCSTAICADKKGNPLIFGGHVGIYPEYTRREITRYNLASGKLEQVGLLSISRYFARESSNLADKIIPFQILEVFVVRLKNGSYFVDGGKAVMKSWFREFHGSSELVSILEK